MSKKTTADSLSSPLLNLSISSHSDPKPAPTKPSKTAPIVDSWDEEALSEEDDGTSTASDDETDSANLKTSQQTSTQYPKAPPPTPAMLSPTASNTEWTTRNQYQGLDGAFDDPTSPTTQSPSSRGTGTFNRTISARDPDKRPEKSTAVASRLIAAGLGVKAPKKTEEQRLYEKSIREQERRKKEREIQERKKEEEQRERAKAAVWED